MDREGRVAYCSAELLAVLRAQHAATRELEREKGIIVPRVFHRKGRRILRFLASWQTACTKAGVKTRSVFERYNIVSEAGLKDAAKKIAAHHQSAGTLSMHLPKLVP